MVWEPLLRAHRPLRRWKKKACSFMTEAISHKMIVELERASKGRKIRKNKGSLFYFGMVEATPLDSAG